MCIALPTDREGIGIVTFAIVAQASKLRAAFLKQRLCAGVPPADRPLLVVGKLDRQPLGGLVSDPTRNKAQTLHDICHRRGWCRQIRQPIRRDSRTIDSRAQQLNGHRAGFIEGAPDDSAVAEGWESLGNGHAGFAVDNGKHGIAAIKQCAHRADLARHTVESEPQQPVDLRNRRFAAGAIDENVEALVLPIQFLDGKVG